MKRFQIYVFFKWLNLLFERKDSEVSLLRGYYLQRISEEHKLISAKKQNKKKKAETTICSENARHTVLLLSLYR